MKTRVQSGRDPDLLPEYDFSKGVRGKYYDRVRQSSNVVILDPDVAEAFPNAEAVNGALRVLASVARRARAAKPGAKSSAQPRKK